MPSRRFRYAGCRQRLRWLVFGFVLLLSACRVELFSNLDEVDANAVLEVLHAEGIVGYKVAGESGRFRVEVDEALLQRALQVARERGVPRQRFTTMAELFKKEGLISSPSEERVRYIFAVSQELAQTLSQIDGVISARVHPVIPANDPLVDKVRPASAAVFIKHRADADLQVMAMAIKTLVTRSIEGLNQDNVSLTFFAVPVRNTNAAPTPVRAGSDSGPVGVLLALLALCLASIGAVLGIRWWSAGRLRESSSKVKIQLSRPLPVPSEVPHEGDAAATTTSSLAGQAPLARS